MTWMCMTKVDRGDFIEGQVLALGSRTECGQLADALPAIAIRDDGPVVDARIIVADVPDGVAVRVGDVYRIRKEREK